jgi:hypothetical protein
MTIFRLRKNQLDTQLQLKSNLLVDCPQNPESFVPPCANYPGRFKILGLVVFPFLRTLVEWLLNLNICLNLALRRFKT